MFDPFSSHLPACYGVVEWGDLRRNSPAVTVPSWQEGGTPDERGSGLGQREAAAWIESHLEAAGALILKPIYGQGGQDIFVCRFDSEHGYCVNGEPRTAEEFASLIEGLEENLATEFVEQAGYAEELYPASTNTLRILTLWDYDRDEPFVAGAVHRIGTDASAPVENWSRGGLSAEIRDDGLLSAAAGWESTAGELRWCDVHPDTGGRIEWREVPGWSAVRDRVLEMAGEFPYLPRLGWDVVITGDGEFRVLEINAHAGIKTLQVHRPHLEDPRVRRFYEYHGYA
ncbi:MAG: sugar-transfer associated ATP-grasp domain-containing protein [Haloarculaceae archaeon]